MRDKQLYNYDSCLESMDCVATLIYKFFTSKMSPIGPGPIPIEDFLIRTNKRTGQVQSPG